MTPPDSTPDTPLDPPATGRGLKLILALSLAVNLGIAGLATGAWLKDGGGGRGQGLMGFAPFSEAMSREDRRALRHAMLPRTAELASAREAAKAEFESLVSALRDEAAGPAAIRAALTAIAAHNTARLDLAHELIEAHLLGMSASERNAFADRLEAALHHRD